MQSVYIVTSKMLGQREQLNSIANNVANANTAGFKREEYDFSTLVARKEGQRVGAFSQDRGTYMDFSSGQYTTTGNPLDVAVLGEGFFAVERNGRVEYTRNGSFNLSADGTLVANDGSPVLDTNNGPVQIPAGSKQVVITPEGAITTEQGVVAQLGIFQFTPEENQQLLRAGNSGYIAPQGVEPVAMETPRVQQGMVESSNVNPVEETVKMTDMLRSYQSAANLVNSMEDLQSRVIRQLPSMP